MRTSHARLRDASQCNQWAFSSSSEARELRYRYTWRSRARSIFVPLAPYKVTCGSIDAGTALASSTSPSIEALAHLPGERSAEAGVGTRTSDNRRVCRGERGAEAGVGTRASKQTGVPGAFWSGTAIPCPHVHVHVVSQFHHGGLGK